MEFEKIVAVAGMPGLYHVIGQRPNGLVLEQIGNASKKFATSARQKVSVLSDIAMFTDGEDVKLAEILLSAEALTKKGTTLPGKKDDDKAIIEAFGKVLPNYDKERVYVSDMKKMFGWFHELNGNIDFEILKEKKEDTETKDSKETKTKETKAKKVAPKSVAKVKTKTGVTKQSKSAVPRKSS